MCEALEKAVAAINKEQPEQILAGIPTEKLKTIPNEICGLLVNNGLSFQQAELLLEVAKGRLRGQRFSFGGYPEGCEECRSFLHAP